MSVIVVVINKIAKQANVTMRNVNAIIVLVVTSAHVQEVKQDTIVDTDNLFALPQVQHKIRH